VHRPGADPRVRTFQNGADAQGTGTVLSRAAIAAGGVVTFASGFLPWYRVEVGYGGQVFRHFSPTAWQSPSAGYSIAAILTAALAGLVAAAGLLMLVARRRALVRGGWRTLPVALGLASGGCAVARFLRADAVRDFAAAGYLVAAAGIGLVVIGGSFLLAEGSA
jgi:hypothetical protein